MLGVCFCRVWSDTPSRERLCAAVWFPSRPVICFLSAHKEDIKWAHSRQMSDRRAHRWWQTQKKKKANPQNYSQPLSRLLCSLFFSPTSRLAGGLSGVSGPGVTHHERGCQHQVVPLITGLLLSLLGVPALSLITRCIYSSHAPLDFLQMHSLDSSRVCSQMSSILSV